MKRYSKLSEAWAQSKPHPNSPQEVSTFIVNTLKRHKKADVEVQLLIHVFNIYEICFGSMDEITFIFIDITCKILNLTKETGQMV